MDILFILDQTKVFKYRCKSGIPLYRRVAEKTFTQSIKKCLFRESKDKMRMEYFTKTYNMFMREYDEYPEEEVEYKDRLQDNLEVGVLNSKNQFSAVDFKKIWILDWNIKK